MPKDNRWSTANQDEPESLFWYIENHGPALFSAVIVNNNYGRFWPKASTAFLAQDFPAADFEIIVVDDGSTDDSLAIARRYKDKIKVIEQRNQKQAGAFKSGFAAARGQVFCLLDADDYCHPGKLSAFAEAFRDPQAGIAQHYLRDVDENGRELDNPLPSWRPVYTLDDMLDGRCENAATSGLAFRRSLLEKGSGAPDAFATMNTCSAMGFCTQGP